MLPEYSPTAKLTARCIAAHGTIGRSNQRGEAQQQELIGMTSVAEYNTAAVMSYSNVIAKAQGEDTEEEAGAAPFETEK